MRTVVAVLLLLSLSTACNADVLAKHQGSADPVTEGWTKYRPFLNVATFPVINDLGLGINAWGIDDSLGFGPPGHDGVYGVVLSAENLAKLDNGWRYSVQLRIADGNVNVARDSITAFVADGQNTYTMQFGKTTSGKPLVMLTTGEDIGPTFEVDDPNGGYHLYELVYNPNTQDAEFYVDGALTSSAYNGRPGGGLDLGNPMGAVGNISFGSTSNNFTGHANWNLARFFVVPEPLTAAPIVIALVSTLVRQRSRFVNR